VLTKGDPRIPFNFNSSYMSAKASQENSIHNKLLLNQIVEEEKNKLEDCYKAGKNNHKEEKSSEIISIKNKNLR